MRTLLLLDGTNHLEEALGDTRALCDPGDKLTILSIADKPSAALLGYEPSPTHTEPYTGGPVGGIAGSGNDVPVFETDKDTEARVSGDLRDELDEKVAEFNEDGVEVWTQAIVRDQPGEAVAEYIRSSDIGRVIVPRSSLPRLQELMTTSDDGKDALEGRLAPLIVLPT